MQNDHKLQQVYTERMFNIMSSLFLSNLKIRFSSRSPEKEVRDGQDCEGSELIGFDPITRHFQVPRICHLSEVVCQSLDIFCLSISTDASVWRFQSTQIVVLAALQLADCQILISLFRYIFDMNAQS